MAHSINCTIPFWLQESLLCNVGKDNEMMKIPGHSDQHKPSCGLAATNDYKINISLTISHNQNWFDKQNMQLL